MINVYKFNQKRNKFKLDGVLEKSMLLEEIQEFYDAEDMADRVDARLDVDFVFRGTLMKFNYAGKNVDPELFTLNQEFMTIANAVLIEEFDSDQNLMNKIMGDCWTIVVECNAMKTANLDENGKVRKEINGMEVEIPNATELIREKLKSAGLM